MNEEFLHFIYKHRLWKNSIKLTSGKKIEIIDTGIPNYNSGPDFFNAKIKTDDTIWAGNVEIHINSSDWYRHKHDQDLSYDNVILHVVFNHDKEIKYKNGQDIPTWEMRFDHALYNNYSKLKNNDSDIPCTNYIELIDKSKISLFLEKLAIERLKEKTEYIYELLSQTKNNWEHVFYIILARTFGFGTNALPFEQMARNTPINIIRKYSGNIFVIEALLFGQSGLLDENADDEYAAILKKEYDFLRKKHKLNPIPAEMWKKAKIRPVNFPTVRIAQFSRLLTNFHDLFSVATNISQAKNLKKYFETEPSEYWRSHYVFGKHTEKGTTGIGSGMSDIIIINTIIPFMFCFFTNYHSADPHEIAISWLNNIKPENNKNVRVWKKLGIIPDTAFESQALIQLKNNYCDMKKCLDCNIGYEIMKEINKL
ncbi:MAG: DUF2851 family protein [Bacteroidales bacterium]|jgi:hypothetical protein|nr:DUF2851 family protein [Bacteroidales bacterium]